MKYLILLAVVVAVVWWLRGSGRRKAAPPNAPPSEPAKRELPEHIVACAQCGLHLPARDALPGRGGVFCGEAHRADYERQHPAR